MSETCGDKELRGIGGRWGRDWKVCGATAVYRVDGCPVCADHYEKRRLRDGVRIGRVEAISLTTQGAGERDEATR